MRIDSDTHFLPRTWLDRVNHPLARQTLKMEWHGEDFVFLRDGNKVNAFGPTEWDLKQRIPHMDAEGFDVQVLIPENRPLIYETDPGLGCALARAYNDAAAADCRGLSRFLGVAWVYLPEVQEATRELDRAIKTLGLRAVKVMGSFNGVHLGGEALYPFYQKVAALDIPILVHPPGRTVDSQPVNPALVGAELFGEEFGFVLGAALGFPFTYMLIIAQLILSGTLDRFPTLKFGFFEAGAGWVPYLMDRLDTYYHAHLGRGAARKTRVLLHVPSVYFDRLYVAAMSTETYLANIVKTLPDHRILIGSDFPHADPNATWPHTITDLQTMEGLPAEQMDRILEVNPQQFFAL